MDATLWAVAGAVVMTFLSLCAWVAWAAVVVGSMAEAAEERARAIREEAARRAKMAVTDGTERVA
jgi:hypothetical protein